MSIPMEPKANTPIEADAIATRVRRVVSSVAGEAGSSPSMPTFDVSATQMAMTSRLEGIIEFTSVPTPPKTPKSWTTTQVTSARRP